MAFASTTAGRRIAEGQMTQEIYTLIQQQKYSDVISHLQLELQVRTGEARAMGSMQAKCSKARSRLAHAQNSPDNRAALSLLGHCYYYTGQFEQAVHM
jgi:tetratricopeptide repeat protein 30